MTEDIYGRLRDREGRVVEVEPTKREFIARSEEIDEQTCKRIRGLLNRLTAANLMAISSQIEGLLKTTSRHQINLCLSKCIEDLVVRDHSLSPQRLISENAMLVTVLHCNIGDEIGGQIIHYFVKKFDDLLSETKNDEDRVDSKKLDNTVAFLCYLAACNLMDVSLMFEIIEKIYQDFSSKSVELILLILKVIGFVLRRGDPGKMRQMILDVQKASSNFQSQDKRIRFMLDALNAVKNNNLGKLNTISEDTSLSQVDVQALRSALKNGIKNSTSVSCLPGRYEKVLTGSRWWIKTDNYVEEELKESKMNRQEKEKEKSVTLDANSEKLCSKLRLVTPLRKNVFKALITCEDYVECCQRLVKIGGRQFIEVVNVCMLLALKEKHFNNFYVYLLDKLACLDRKYKLAVMCALRDRLNDLERLSLVERKNLAKLIAELIKRNAIPITVLKAVQFSDLDQIYMQLLKDVLGPVLALDENQLIKILSKIKPKDPFAKALKLFITCFVNSDCDIVAVWPKNASR